MDKDSEDKTATRRILCIDGGGIKGTQPAAFLAALEEDLDRPIGEYFDLIAGTSTGGLIAMGLALGHSAKSLLALYEERGPKIFGQSEGGGQATLRAASVSQIGEGSGTALSSAQARRRGPPSGIGTGL